MLSTMLKISSYIVYLEPIALLKLIYTSDHR